MDPTGGPGMIRNWPFPASYLVQINFSMLGRDGAARELRSWVRKEAQGWLPVPTAKAAAIPYDPLKWLSTLRLDAARRAAGLTVSRTLDELRAFATRFPVPTGSPVLPDYSSVGAWSTATAKAKRQVLEFEADPVGFERRALGFWRFP